MGRNNMRYSLTILFIGLTAVNVKGVVLPENFTPCPEVCPALYAPVCASNGNTYTQFGNDCVLQAANCRLRHTGFKAFLQTDMDWCTTEYVESLNAVPDHFDITRPECQRPCTMIYAPICVSNGKYRTTASSQCVLDVYNCVVGLNGSNAVFKILKQGIC